MQRTPTSPHPSPLLISGDARRLALEGRVDIATLGQLQDSLRQENQPRTLDLGQVSGLDTPGALLLCRLRQEGFTLPPSARNTRRCWTSFAAWS